MTRGWIYAAAAAVTLGLAAPAGAAGDEGDGLGAFFYEVLNILILIVVLVYFARKPVRAFFADRREQIDGDLKSAAKLHAEAESRYAQWQRKLAELDSELDRIRTTARERAEAERERILAEASAAAERIRTEARAAVEQELRRARAKLREEASDLAVSIAADTLRDRVTPEDRSRLLDEFIETIERDSSNAGGNA